MKTNEERLRTVAKEAFTMLRDVSYDQYEPEEVEEMMGKLDMTITETADGPQLDLLVEWLEQKQARMRSVVADDERLGMEVNLHDVSIAIAEVGFVLDHIREMQGITARPREERGDG